MIRRLLKPLLRWVRDDENDYSAFVLGEVERLQMIADVQLNTFAHLDPDEVKWVTSWALTLGECSDAELLRAWEAVHCGN